MLITLHSQNRSTDTVDVDTASNFTNAFNETITLPRNAKVGVVSLSVNLNGEIVINASNKSFTVELGSHTITVNIPEGTYKVQETSSGSGTSTTTYPLIEAIQTALTNAINSDNMEQLYPPAENTITDKKVGSGIGIQMDLKPTSDKTTNNGVDASTTNTIRNSIDSDLSSKISRNSFAGTPSNIAYGSSGVFSVLDCSAEKLDVGQSQNTRYGEAIFRLGETGTKAYMGLWRSTQPNNTPTSFAGFRIDETNKIYIQENNEQGQITFDTGSAYDTAITNDGSGNYYLRVVLPSGNRPVDRRPRYFISTDGQTSYKEMNLTGISASSRKQYRSTARLYVGVSFETPMKSRPAVGSLDSGSGQWSITTAGTGLTAGVLTTMSSTTSTNGVITNGSINISSVDGSGAMTGFDESNGAVRPDLSSAGDFVEGDTITFANGVVITKTSDPLTTQRVKPQIRGIVSTVVDNPTRNPMLPNIEPIVNFNTFLADIFNVPRRNVGGGDGSLNIVSESPLDVDAHQPDIYISVPTLPINSRTDKISHNTLARVPVGNIDNDGTQAGIHFHECYNVLYHRLGNANEQILSQMDVRLTDKDGGDISQLLHPSVLTLHIDVAST